MSDSSTNPAEKKWVPLQKATEAMETRAVAEHVIKTEASLLANPSDVLRASAARTSGRGSADYITEVDSGFVNQLVIEGKLTPKYVESPASRRKEAGKPQLGFVEKMNVEAGLSEVNTSLPSR